MSDFADSLFADVDPHRPSAPVPEFYPGSKRKIPDKPVTEPPKKAPSAKAWDAHPQTLTVNGTAVEFFTIGALATALNRQAVTIRSWETKGVIPKARYRTGGEVKRRLYTRRQVEGLMALCHKHGILDFEARPDAIPKGFTDDVVALWQEPL